MLSTVCGSGIPPPEQLTLGGGLRYFTNAGQTLRAAESALLLSNAVCDPFIYSHGTTITDYTTHMLAPISFAGTRSPKNSGDT
ncbi:MAG: hypothetical protein ACT4PU_07240 [Planctomycetota bacterium]